MSSRTVFLSAWLLGAVATVAEADPPVVKKTTVPSALDLIKNMQSSDALAGTLRGALVRTLPTTLYESSPGWGHTRQVSEIKWKGQGLHVHPEKVHKDKNDGDWRKIRVSADNLADTLILDLRNVQWPDEGGVTFALFLSFDSKVDYTHQKWDKGARLWDSSVQARLRVKLTLNCEITTRLEPGSSVLPDAVFRFRVTKADLQYDQLVVEHIAGIGGTGAKLLGDAARRMIHDIKPNLERDLLAKADAAIVKAGDTKEVRVRVSDLFKKKH
jgi:hypothetical protein